MPSAFDQYLRASAPTLSDVLPLLELNAYARRSFRLVLKTGEARVGVPTLRDSGDRVSIIFHAGADHCFEIPLDDVASASPLDVEHEDRIYLKIAIDESRRSKFEGGRARPYVGAVVVKDDIEVGRGHRGAAGDGVHAEHGLLDIDLKEVDLVGATIYTTLEPCTARGPGEVECVQRIIDRRIGRVVIGTLDPNQVIKGEGVWRLREANVRVSLCDHVQMATLEDINRTFFREFRHRLPGRGPDARSRWRRVLSAVLDP